MKRGIPQLPKDYDADIVAKAIQSVVTNQPSVPEASTGPAPTSPPSAGRIRLKITSQLDSSLLGTEQDPRILYASGVEGIEVRGAQQRFRLEAPIDWCPWVVYASQASSASNLWTPVVWFQKFLVGIPHALGRIPERLVTSIIPEHHVFRVTSYPTTASKGCWQVGDTVRAYVDVWPLFAKNIDDVNRLLSFIIGTLGGSAVPVDGGYNWQHFNTGASAPYTVLGGASSTTGHDFHAGLSGSLVTTEEKFSALVSVCVWGNPARRSEQSGTPGGTLITNPGFRDFFGASGERTQEYRELNLIWPLPFGRTLALLATQAKVGATVSIWGADVCDGTVAVASIPTLATTLTGSDAITLTWEKGMLDFIIE